MSTFGCLTDEIGALLAMGKNRLTCLGFEIDTEKMIVRIPLAKLDILKNMVQNFLHRNKVTV
jgi:hypothetical protein